MPNFFDVSILCILFDLVGIIINWHNSLFIKEISPEFQLQEEKISIDFDKNFTNISTGSMLKNNFSISLAKNLNHKN